MDASIPTTVLNCTQCGGELHPNEGELFLTCPYCGATVYLDKSRVVFHWYLAPTVSEGAARESLARWMAGNQTVKDLDKKSRIAGQAFEYFPMWYFKRKVGAEEKVILLPAAATSVTELRNLPLTAGDLQKYDPALAGQSQAPTVPLPSAQGWAVQDAPPGTQLTETALVHIPIYTFKYIFNNRPYTAIVEAGSGKVLANIYPAKAEAPYITAGCITASVYLALAFIPIILSGTRSGTGLGILIYIGLALLAAPFLLALAAWTAAKI